MLACEKTEEKYTSDEFLSMTELEGRYELIDGEVYDMTPAPDIQHQSVSSDLHYKIKNYILSHKGKCRVFYAPTDVKLDDENTVQPDLLVLCDSDKLDKQKVNGAPDWVIEILSPSSIKHDTVVKLELYMRAGVREYWIVDPENEKVLVYNFNEPKLVGVFRFTDDITVGIYKDAPEPLIIRVKDE